MMMMVMMMMLVIRGGPDDVGDDDDGDGKTEEARVGRWTKMADEGENYGRQITGRKEGFQTKKELRKCRLFEKGASRKSAKKNSG